MRYPKSKFILCLCYFFLTFTLLLRISPVYGKTLHIPSEHSTIQAAIDAADDGDVLRVADGIYTGEGNRNIDFKGKGIVLESENGPEMCIIDCEQKSRGFHFRNQETETSVVSGFTITNGQPQGDGMIGGMGGGIFAENYSSPTIQNCIIRGNNALYGGGIASFLSANTYMRVSNCILTDNEARHGGAVFCQSKLIISHCTITGNRIRSPEGAPSENGGGINCLQSAMKLTNSIVWGNEPDEIYNTYFYQNGSLDVAYSVVKHGYAGDAVRSSDPQFADPENGDYHLSQNSPCIDTGTSDDAPDTDIEGNPRPRGAGHDMGAFESEFTGTANRPPVIDAFTLTPVFAISPSEVTCVCTAHDPDGTIASYQIDYDEHGFSPGTGKVETNTTGIFTHTYRHMSQTYSGIIPNFDYADLYDIPRYEPVCTVTDDEGVSVSASADVQILPSAEIFDGSEGTFITSDIWISAHILTEEKWKISAVWRKGGEDKTESGDTVIWGYFYADPSDVNWGSPDNPDLFVKIWFDHTGRIDVNYFHVSVPKIVVESAHIVDLSRFSDNVADFDGPAMTFIRKENTANIYARYVRHTYEGHQSFRGTGVGYGIPDKDDSPSGSPLANSVINDLNIAAVIRSETGESVDARWHLGGQDITERGDQVVWGYFYGDPDDFTWGSRENPDMFVKIWFDVSRRVDVNFFHVSVPDIEVFSDLSETGDYDQKSTTTMDKRYIRHEYWQSDQ